MNRLRHALQQYYPQVLEWFSEHNTVAFCDFVSQWPTPNQARRARKASLERFFKSHHVNSAQLIEKRITAIKAATPLTLDAAVIEPHGLQMEILIEQLRITIKALKRFDDVMAASARKLPDYDLLFSPLPGAAKVLAPRLMAAFGEDRQRFQRADALQQYSGIASAQTINKSAWAGAYYWQQLAKGCSYQVAVRALAFKWIHFLHRCWLERTPYNESKYLEALRRKGSHLLKYLAEAA